MFRRQAFPGAERCAPRLATTRACHFFRLSRVETSPVTCLRPVSQGPLQTSPFGNGRFNPFNLDYTPEEYAEKQLQEIKHCRLAMLAIAVMYLKTTGFEAGEGILGDLGVGAFTQPEYFEKAGYFFPDGV